jgi:hypothetical protein
MEVRGCNRGDPSMVFAEQAKQVCGRRPRAEYVVRRGREPHGHGLDDTIGERPADCLAAPPSQSHRAISAARPIATTGHSALDEGSGPEV